MKDSSLLFVVCIALLPVDQEAADAISPTVPLRPLEEGTGGEEKEGGAGFIDDDID